MADSGRITPDEAETLELYDPSPASRVRMRSVKLFTDGALGSWGAALLSPYTDKPEVSGIMRLPEEELDRAARTWWSRGWGVVSIDPVRTAKDADQNASEHSCHRRPRQQGRIGCI